MKPRTPNTRWSVAQQKGRGTSMIVREREGQTIIGGLVPFHGKTGIAYMATRPDGKARDFFRRFDACAWLMDGFDAEVEG